MNELIVIAILLCLITVPYVCIRLFANLCWIVHRKVYNGKMNRAKYVEWFLDTVWE